ncbi:hypothetical protein ACHAQA_004978 [Verticillium albo-atrum]
MTAFAAKAHANGILHVTLSDRPKNSKDILNSMNRHRATPSPTENAYQRFVGTISRAQNEATVSHVVATTLLNHSTKDNYFRSFNQPFTNVPQDVAFNEGLSPPQPDFIEGLEVDEFAPCPIGEYIDGAVLFEDDPRSLALPHIAGEFKGPGKDMRQGRLQSAYDGAFLTHARGQALDHIGKPDSAGDAKVVTFTTDGNILDIFSHHCTTEKDGTRKFHQYNLSSTNLIATYEGFKQGRLQLRNAQDYALEESCALRDRLREHWKTMGVASDNLAIPPGDEHQIVDETILQPIKSATLLPLSSPTDVDLKGTSSQKRRIPPPRAAKSHKRRKY